MPRKSMTISEDNDKKIQNIRLLFLGSDLHMDIDYTTAANILIDIGDIAFNRADTDNININLEEIADKIIKNLKKNKANQEFWISALPPLLNKSKEISNKNNSNNPDSTDIKTE